MDPERFDRLSRRLSTAGTRRHALTVAVAAALAPLAAAARPEPAACLPSGKRCSQSSAAAAGHGKDTRKKKGKHHPPSCDKCCSRFGAAGSDGKPRCTCKSEGIACDNPSQCCSGQCRDNACTACPPNTVFCPDGCANLQTNPNHCGTCGHACDSGQRCQEGTCICDAQSCPTGCCGGAEGTTCLRGTSDQACGSGGAPCQQCMAPEGGSVACQRDGTCAQTCPPSAPRLCNFGPSGTCEGCCNDNDCAAMAGCQCGSASGFPSTDCLNVTTCSCVADCADCPSATHVCAPEGSSGACSTSFPCCERCRAS